MTLPKRLWLCVPPVILFACDTILTLGGQSSAYWQGDFADVLEGNPLVYELMRYGPWVSILAAVVYAVGFSIVMGFWRNSLTVVMSFLLTLSHATGSASWLVRHGIPGVLAALGLFLLAERLLGICWGLAGVREKTSNRRAKA